MADRELSHDTESKFRRAIADALGAAPDGGMADAVMEQIRDLLVAVDVNADRRGYERAEAEFRIFKPGGPVSSETNPVPDFPLETLSPPETVLLITRDGTEVMRVRI